MPASQEAALLAIAQHHLREFRFLTMFLLFVLYIVHLVLLAVLATFLTPFWGSMGRKQTRRWICGCCQVALLQFMRIILGPNRVQAGLSVLGKHRAEAPTCQQRCVRTAWAGCKKGLRVILIQEALSPFLCIRDEEPFPAPCRIINWKLENYWFIEFQISPKVVLAKAGDSGCLLWPPG